MRRFQRAAGSAIRRLFGPHATEHIRFLLKYPRHYPRLRGYLNVDGWLGHPEAVNLYGLARRIPRENPTIVQIGCWMGRSAIVLAKAVAGAGG